jgi:polyisoprenoid-binding protein YceI
METLKLGPADGTLSVHTEVAGGAAKVGHSLVIAVADWSADVGLRGAEPVSVSLEARVDSMAVVSGSGGLRPLSGLDKEMIRNNAMRSMSAKAHPEIRFRSDAVQRSPEAVVVTGQVTIAGQTRALAATLTVTEAETGWRVTTVIPLTQTEFGVKPYSLMFGQLRVADEVAVHLDVDIGADRI